MLKVILGLLLSAFLLLWLLVEFYPYQPLRAPISQLIVFGDSLSDSAAFGDAALPLRGNNHWVPIQGVLGRRGAPITSLNQATPARRDTWVNAWLNALKQPLYIRRSAKPVMANTVSMSYAVASATTIDGYTNDLAGVPMRRMPRGQCHGFATKQPGFSCVPGVLKQVATYLSDVENKPNPEALFIIWAGGNDLYDNIVRVMKHGFKRRRYHPINNIGLAVKRLIAAGVSPRQIYVLDLPDFSMVPAVVDLLNKASSPGIKRRLLFSAVSIVSQSYNVYLKMHLMLTSGFQFAPYQVFPIGRLFLQIHDVKSPLHQQLHLRQTLDTTCVDMHQNPHCQGFIFYNKKHPTTGIHYFLSQSLKHYILG